MKLSKMTEFPALSPARMPAATKFSGHHQIDLSKVDEPQRAAKRAAILDAFGAKEPGFYEVKAAKGLVGNVYIGQDGDTLHIGVHSVQEPVANSTPGHMRMAIDPGKMPQTWYDTSVLMLPVDQAITATVGKALGKDFKGYKANNGRGKGVVSRHGEHVVLSNFDMTDSTMPDVSVQADRKAPPKKQDRPMPDIADALKSEQYKPNMDAVAHELLMFDSGNFSLDRVVSLQRNRNDNTVTVTDTNQDHPGVIAHIERGRDGQMHVTDPTDGHELSLPASATHHPAHLPVSPTLEPQSKDKPGDEEVHVAS